MYGSQLKLCTHCISAPLLALFVLYYTLFRSPFLSVSLSLVSIIAHGWPAASQEGNMRTFVRSPNDLLQCSFISPTIFYTLDFRVRACYSITIITALRLNGNLRQIIQIRRDFLLSCIFMLRCFPCVQFSSARGTIQQ